MKNTLINKTKSGAASFYMVAFSTLILIIIVTSFAAVIISEVTRTANDDLSQSAYDSALAGVEDAKLVAYNYQKCVNEKSGDDWCLNIIDAVEGKNQRCDMVGRILGRLEGSSESEDGSESTAVMIQESNTSNNMNQAYTCVKVSMPSDYRGSISSTNPMKVIKAKFENDDVASAVKWVRLSWSSGGNEDSLNFSNIVNNNVVFNDDQTAMPPTISISMLQTAGEFELDDFAKVEEGQTNRGTLYLVPTNDEGVAGDENNDTHAAGYKDGENKIDEFGFINSNNQAAKNLPYTVLCQLGGAYDCSTTIEIPDPIGGERNPETFIFVVALPNGGQDADFQLVFGCNEECSAGDGSIEFGNGEEEEEGGEVVNNIAKLNVQIKIDSTGRANDMYRRVETRLESEASGGILSLMGPLELLGKNEDELLKKDISTTREFNF